MSDHCLKEDCHCQSIREQRDESERRLANLVDVIRKYEKSRWIPYPENEDKSKHLTISQNSMTPFDRVMMQAGYYDKTA